jgi:hypothetical protein
MVEFVREIDPSRSALEVLLLQAHRRPHGDMAPRPQRRAGACSCGGVKRQKPTCEKYRRKDPTGGMRKVGGRKDRPPQERKTLQQKGREELEKREGAINRGPGRGARWISDEPALGPWPLCPASRGISSAASRDRPHRPMDLA